MNNESNSTSSLLITPTSILATDVEEIGNFFSAVFGFPKHTTSLKPLKHALIHCDGTKSLVVIDKNCCPSHIIDSVESISTRQVYVAVKDPGHVQNLATGWGAQVMESNVDYDNDAVSGMCILEGPERLLIYVFSREQLKVSLPHDIILNSLASKLADNEGADEDWNGRGSVVAHDRMNTKVEGKKKTPMRIQIPTLKVELFSGNSFISCPTNPRYPIPFETELFRGFALVAVRTDPFDAMYQTFFAGKYVNPSKY